MVRLLLVLLTCFLCHQDAGGETMTTSHRPPNQVAIGRSNIGYRQIRETGRLRDAVAGLDICGVVQDAEKAIEFFKDKQGYPATMDIDQKAAVRLYTDECLHKDLNNHLRENNDAGKFQAFVKLLLDALSKLPSSYVKSGEVWRRTTVLNLQEYEVDKLITWKGFTSTSTSKKEAVKFNGNVLFQIKNTRGYDIKTFSKFKREKEILLTPGNTFRVESKSAVIGQGYSYTCVLDSTSSSSGHVPRASLYVPQAMLAVFLLFVALL